jgi:hypothetical protein
LKKAGFWGFEVVLLHRDSQRRHRDSQRLERKKERFLEVRMRLKQDECLW